MSSDPVISFVERDFQSVRTALLNWIKIRFEKDWKEFVDTSVGMAVVDVVAWAHAQRAFYYDMQALNCYLESATLPEAIIAVAKQLGYRRRLTTSASVPITLYPSPPQTAPITVRQGEKLQLEDNLTFEAASDYVIPAGSAVFPNAASTEIITFVQGETLSEEFVSDGSALQYFQLSHTTILQDSIRIEILDVVWEETESLLVIEGSGHGRDTYLSSGLDNQRYQLSLLNVLIEPSDEDVIVVMVSGELWKLVVEFTGAPKEFRATKNQDGETFVHFGASVEGAAPVQDSVIDVLYQITATQRRFVANYAADGTAVIRFGDGADGQIPPDGAVIAAYYRVSGGVVGNVRRGGIDVVVKGYLPSGNTVNVRAYNNEAGSGGEPEESLDSIKRMAPRFAKTNNKAVTQEHFTTLAMSYRDAIYGAPSFAIARLKQRVPELNMVQIVLWSRDAQGRITTASSPLKQGVKSYLDSRRTICTYLEIIDGDVLYFDIDAEVYLKPGRTVSSVLEKVTQELYQHFNSTYVVPGTDLILSLINEKIQDHEHIDASTLTRVQGSRFSELDLGVGDDSKQEFSEYFPVPDGMSVVPTSFMITDGDQVITDDGGGLLVGDIDDTKTNTIGYSRGHFVANFSAAPEGGRFVTAECRIYAFMENTTTKVVDEGNTLDGLVEFAPVIQRRQVGLSDGLTITGYLPTEFLPYAKNRVAFIGGYDNYGAQTGGQLLALDDGYGSFTIDATGEIDYETGRFSLTWNTMPPPVTPVNYFGYLLTAPDGLEKEFEFEVRTASGGGGSLVSLQTVEGIGRSKFWFEDLSTPAVTFKNGYDNGKGLIDGESLNVSTDNTIVYHDPSLLVSRGKVTFQAAPEVASGPDFRLDVTPTALFLYTPFSAFIGSGGPYEKIVFSDGEGRIYGDVAGVYPATRLDYLSGRFIIDMNAPDISGRRMNITYDSFVKSHCKNIPVAHYIMPTFATVNLTEINIPVNI